MPPAWRDRVGKDDAAEVMWKNETTRQRRDLGQPLIRKSALAAAGSVRSNHVANLQAELELARELEAKDPAALDAMPATKRKLEQSRAYDDQLKRARQLVKDGTIDSDPELKALWESSYPGRLMHARELVKDGTIDSDPEIKALWEKSEPGRLRLAIRLAKTNRKALCADKGLFDLFENHQAPRRAMFDKQLVGHQAAAVCAAFIHSTSVDTRFAVQDDMFANETLAESCNMTDEKLRGETERVLSTSMLVLGGKSLRQVILCVFMCAYFSSSSSSSSHLISSHRVFFILNIIIIFITIIIIVAIVIDIIIIVIIIIIIIVIHVRVQSSTLPTRSRL